MPIDRDFQFQPRGGNLDAFCCRDPEVLLYGPSGTGKTLTFLHKMDFCCSKYKDIRCLMLRKTRASLTESAMASFEGKVLREGSAVMDRGLQRKNRTSYRYANGSEIVVGGLDDPEKILSTEYDLIYINEAVEVGQREYDQLLGRNRNFKMPYQQIIMDCNPSHSRHWLKMRAAQPRLDLDGKPTGKPLLTMIKSTHKDNPFYWDEKNRSWTDQGKIYISKLSNLTGVQRDRFFDGEWTNAEGVVYKEFDRSIHVIPRSMMPTIPGHWPRYMAIDFGYQSPLVCLWGAVDPQSKVLYIYREWYMTQMTVEEHAKMLKKLSAGDPQPVAIVCDHDREGRKVLEDQNGWVTVSARKGHGSKEINIQEVRSRLQLDRFGAAGLYIFDDCLVRKDTAWEEAGNPACLVDELESYSYKPMPDRVSPKEEPQDKWDHCVAEGSLIWTACGDVPIDSVVPGDLVMTRKGYRKVIRSMKTRFGAVKEIVSTNAHGDTYRLVVTPDHQVWTENKGWIQCQDLTENHRLLVGTDGFKPGYENRMLTLSSLESIEDKDPVQCYDLEIEGEHEFFANGILVHNSCDALAYMCQNIAGNMGDWGDINTKLPNIQPTILAKDPMEERKWFPFPKLFPDGNAGKGGGLI